MERPENVDFVLKDIKSNILDSYVNSLENRINKAIEYVNGNEDYYYNYPLVNREHLLEILKGSDKE